MSVPSISNRNKIDYALLQALNNTNVTSRYFDMRGYRKALAILEVLPMADTKTAKVEWYQAVSLAGGGTPKVVSRDNLGVTESSATATCPAYATEATAALSTVLAGDTITINGLVFTAHATVTTKASREFSISGDNTADAVELAACINDATYGVPGVTATAATGTITLTSTSPGAKTITLAQSSTTFTFVTTKMLVLSEIRATDLDWAGGYVFVAPKVTVTSNSTIGLLVVRGHYDYVPTQAVGAQTVL